MATGVDKPAPAGADKMSAVRAGKTTATHSVSRKVEMTAEQVAVYAQDIQRGLQLAGFHAGMSRPDWTALSRCLKAAYKSALKLSRTVVKEVVS